MIFHCGREVNAELLKSGRPDAVVLAAGASPSVPKIPGIHGCHVFDARNVLTGRADPAGPLPSSAQATSAWRRRTILLARGIDVTILEMQAAYPVGKHTSHGYWLHLRLKERGARILLGTMVTGIGSMPLPTGRGKKKEPSPRPR